MSSLSTSAPSPASTGRDLFDITVLFVIATAAVLWAQALDPATEAGNLAAMAGVVGCIGWAFLATRWRGETVETLGLSRPASWKRTALFAFGGTIALFVVALSVQNFVLPMLIEETTPDTSRFDVLRGNPLRLLRTLVVVWLTAAFGEEVVYRGFLMGRIARIFGGTKQAWRAALVVSSILFGLIHLYQGVAGIVLTAVVGLMLGLIYLVAGRNLWASILAHGITDTVSLSLLAFGMMPS